MCLACPYLLTFFPAPSRSYRRPHRDVGYETYKAHRQGPTALEAAHFSEPTRLSMIAVKRSVFQSVASMYVLPRRILAARTPTNLAHARTP